MREKMTSQISVNLLPLKDEYHANKTRHKETEKHPDGVIINDL